MSPYWIAIGYACLPAAGNFVGGAIAEMVRIPPSVLGFALHFAAGTILAVVGIELMGTALQTAHPWIIALAFVAGGAAAAGLRSALNAIVDRSGGAGGGAGPWMIYAGVAADLISDGVMIGTSASISGKLALLLALGQVAADIPEGFATIATFRKAGMGRAARLALTASFALPILAATTLGYFAVREAPAVVKFALLSFTAGMLTTIAIEEMIEEAHESGGPKESGWQTLGLAIGFAAFIMLSSWLG
ncbi:ZIP family metal transporter [Noviherbaspirillum pedocola]|uniref:ZIP family metal transporter n=1 Tax=Noviherbaspirillum pedocola TaxID=2801341 RepID=A0A934W2Q1_9BURK|nr:ZIP family metal transporter [Noviherbaspirillum pedocola]MBK4736571.1 ZIP family metal transporter [Noviherbaspirillum pedocola]